MKILMIFIDMLRPGLLHMVDEKQPQRQLEKTFCKWGGTVYTNCFTPAPDTPRSNGCLWSGRYPKDNGCDNRLKYPAHFFKEPDQDLWSVLKDAGYTFNVFMNPSTHAMGELPPCMKTEGNFSGERTLEQFLKEVKIEDDSLTYFCLSDFHNAVTDYYAAQKCVAVADEKIAYTLTTADRLLDIDSFDVILAFSDHGFRFYDEPMPNYAVQLGRMRSQVFMFLHMKGQTGLQKSDKLCSLLDVYPTICQLAGLTPRGQLEGISLLSSDSKLPILQEDHRTFDAQLGQTIEFWGIIDKDGMFYTDSKRNWLGDAPLTEDKKAYYEALLQQKGTNYADNVKMSMVRQYYDRFLVSAPCYLDGQPRQKHPPLKLRIKQLLKKVIRHFV